MSEETLQPDEIENNPSVDPEDRSEDSDTAVEEAIRETPVQDPTPDLAEMSFPQLSLSPSAEEGENANLLMDLSLPVSVELGRTYASCCSNSGVSMFGLMGNGYLYCSVLRSDMDFEKIAAGGQAAQVFTFNGTMKVWVAVTSEANAKVVGITKDGHEIALN